MSVSAIGSAPSQGGSSTAAAPSALEAQLARYERKLSDQVNCSSAKTSAGKTKIRELSDHISRLKKQIQQSSNPTSPDHKKTVPGTLAARDREAAAPFSPEEGATGIGSSGRGRVDLFA